MQCPAEPRRVHQQPPANLVTGHVASTSCILCLPMLLVPAGYTGNYAGHVGATLAFMAGLFDCPAASNYKVCGCVGGGCQGNMCAEWCHHPWWVSGHRLQGVCWVVVVCAAAALPCQAAQGCTRAKSGGGAKAYGGYRERISAYADTQHSLCGSSSLRASPQPASQLVPTKT